jgi:hypothetical protein
MEDLLFGKLCVAPRKRRQCTRETIFSSGFCKASQSAMMVRPFLKAEEIRMARISLIEPESASAEVKEIYEKALRGKPGNVQKALAHRPEMLKAFLSFYATVGRSLDRKLYELIYIRVSLINSCHY